MSTDDAAAPALSIEDFAASIAASLASAASVAAVEPEEAGARERLTLRERVRRRVGRAELLVFRIGRELFGVELIAVEEALDMPIVHRLPEMPPAMLGVFTLRGALVSVFAPQGALGVAYEDAATVVVFCGGERRVALATDDVDDAVTVDLRTVRDAPGVNAIDGSLLGIVHRGSDLIAILDADTLVAAHRTLAGALPETLKESA
jgi:purine-binding chemotaxis protein CheW